MDLETENRIAAILLKEAAELRRQAEQEGVYAYLQQPKVRGRPNSRFLTATVLGVQQANRSVEVNEMWRVRQKELELNDRLKGGSRDERSCNRHRDVGNSRISSKKHDIDVDYATASCSSSKREHESSNSREDEGLRDEEVEEFLHSRRHRDVGNSSRSSSKKHDIDVDCATMSRSSSKREHESSNSREDEGLRDEEVEEFLHSRVKRGRGAVGSRMDETGPYLPASPDSNEKLSARSDVRQHRIFGPGKPYSIKLSESSDVELDEGRQKKTKKGHSGSSNKKHSKKHKSKEKSRHKKKKREKKRSKHHK